MKKKILILANSDEGIWKFRRELITALLAEADVYVSIPAGGVYEENIRSLGCTICPTPVDRRGTNPVRDLGLYRAYKRLLREVAPDYVITYTIKPNVYGGYACRRRKVPYAVNVTGLGTAFQGGGLLTKLVTVMNKAGCKKAGVVFFENEENRNIFVEKGIVPASVTRVLHGAGVNLDNFPLAAYPAENAVTKFLFIGRVMREKGVGELFAAMRRLRAEGYACELHILGGFEEDYKTTLDECTAEGWLHYHGYQNDVRPFITDTNCFVLPSYHEGMANVNLECAATGRPVITSRIHGCMEAVVEGVSGLLCEKQNADSLYEAMKTFLEMPHEARAAMGRAGRAHMEAVFDKKLVVAETVGALGLDKPDPNNHR